MFLALGYGSVGWLEGLWKVLVSEESSEAGMRGLDDVTVLGPRVCGLNFDGGESRVARVAS